MMKQQRKKRCGNQANCSDPGQLFGSATATGQETAQGPSRRMREEGEPRRDYDTMFLVVTIFLMTVILNDCDS